MKAVQLGMCGCILKGCSHHAVLSLYLSLNTSLALPAASHVTSRCVVICQLLHYFYECSYLSQTVSRYWIHIGQRIEGDLLLRRLEERRVHIIILRCAVRSVKEKRCSDSFLFRTDFGYSFLTPHSSRSIFCNFLL